MREELKKLPQALARQIGIRMGLGVAVLVATFLIGILFHSADLCLPGAILTVFLLGSGSLLLWHSIMGDYIKLTGTCTQVEHTQVRQKIWAVFLNVDGIPLKLNIHQRIQAIAEGDILTLYLSRDTPVYEDGSMCRVYSYYALEISKPGLEKPVLDS